MQRTILMATMAAMLGALPLALGTGMGSEFRRPPGIAIIGGLAVSRLRTLYTTPVVYLCFDRLQIGGIGLRGTDRSRRCPRLPKCEKARTTENRFGPRINTDQHRSCLWFDRRESAKIRSPGVLSHA